jgi:hypothetical protein
MMEILLQLLMGSWLIPASGRQVQLAEIGNALPTGPRRGASSTKRCTGWPAQYNASVRSTVGKENATGLAWDAFLGISISFWWSGRDLQARSSSVEFIFLFLLIPP